MPNSTSFLEFFETSERNLAAAEAAAGVGHHVALSVVGTDRMLASGYFRAKMAQENLIKASPISPRGSSFGVVISSNTQASFVFSSANREPSSPRRQRPWVPAAAGYVPHR
jgi:hypothetical protein